MGIDTGVAMVVGLPYDEIDMELRGESGEDYYHAGLSRVSPWYDCEDEYCYFGVEIAQDYYESIELDILSLPDQIEKAKQKFFDITGQEGKLYISAHVS